jgi:ABC-type Fe3+/spermidine/putrescine transport system ATPase subunit
MNKARIEQVGSPEEVYSKPKNRFVADFMGAANFIPARLVSQVEPNDGFVIVRPENLKLGSDTRGLQAKIVEIHFLGSHYEYQLRGDNDLALVARLPATSAPHEVGSVVHITFKDADIHWVPT